MNTKLYLVTSDKHDEPSRFVLANDWEDPYPTNRPTPVVMDAAVWDAIDRPLILQPA